jgi:hypothetical protein
MEAFRGSLLLLKAFELWSNRNFFHAEERVKEPNEHRKPDQKNRQRGT